MQEDQSIGQCADILSALGCTKSTEQLSIFANLLAIAISKGKSADQLNVIGNFIVAVGSLLLTMAAQKSSCETKLDTLAQIKDLKKKIKDLEDSLS